MSGCSNNRGIQCSNVFSSAVQDASEAVEEKVRKKFQGSGGWRKLVASRAARAASGIASPPVVASMLAEKLPQKMIDLMQEKGITVTVDEVFREGEFAKLTPSEGIVLFSQTNKEWRSFTVLFQDPTLFSVSR